jgi:hypothetical protein
LFLAFGDRIALSKRSSTTPDGMIGWRLASDGITSYSGLKSTLTNDQLPREMFASFVSNNDEIVLQSWCVGSGDEVGLCTSSNT